MKKMNDCLVMIISKYPTVGKVKTRLGSSIGLVEATDVFQAMLLDLLDNHKNKSYNVIIETEPENIEEFKILVPDFHVHAACGDDLRGQNSILWNAFKHYCKDYHKVISLYVDAPFVDSNLLTEGFEMLEQCDVVLGPCLNGGYYLVGMCKPVDLFTPHKKGRFPYYEETIRLLEEMKLSYQLLEPRYDIDTVDDIKATNWDSTSGVWSRTISQLNKLGLI
jgi:glycosyltransferase A (GT-A) superfamily protein (DUF2064 family)